MDVIPDPDPIIMDRYEILRELDSGGFGVVYVAATIPTRALVAVKRNTTELEDQYWLEIEVLRAISHLNFFPALICHGPPDNEEYIVMSFEGPSMLSIARYSPGGYLSKRNVLLFIYHATKAVKALHDMGYVHRDIKPANFVLGRSLGKAPVVLIDFGFAQNFHQEGFQRPTRNFLNVTQAAPQILRGGLFTTMVDWFLVAHSTLDLAGYPRHSSNNTTMPYEERAHRIDARFAEFRSEFDDEDRYLIPLLTCFYTPGVNAFDAELLCNLVLAFEGFNPDEPFLVEEDPEED